jgi:predicted permease
MWLRSVSARRRLEQEMEDEVTFHLEARAADLERSGMNAAEARRKARVEFGGIASHKDGMRFSLGLRWWDDLLADLRYAVRLLRKSPGFTFIAVGSLALAIGVNTSIFSVANEVMYERLGVPHPEQLRLFQLHGDKHVVIHSSWGDWNRDPNGGWAFDVFTYPIYQQLRHDTHVTQEIFAFKDLGRANVTANGEAQVAEVEMVSGNFYAQMQVKLALGRGIQPADDATPGAGAVVVLSDGFWTRSFARDPNILGKVITVNTLPMTVVGVNPRAFTGAKQVQTSPDVFMPLSMIPLMKAASARQGPFLTTTKLWWVQLMAREKPGVSNTEAEAALTAATQAAIRATMTVGKDQTMPRVSLDDGSRGLNFTGRQLSKPVYVLMAMTGFVLLLACANLANLMLARAAARQREMGVRLALGAARSRILRQVLTESLMIAAAGGGFGMLVGYFGGTLFPKLTMNAWEKTEIHVPFDWKIFAFTAAITVLTGILFGVAPAWRATRAEIGITLKDTGKSSTRRSKGLSGKAIVGFQIALSTLLVAGSALFLRTLWNLNRIDPGFRTDHLVLFDINPPDKKYPAPKDIALHVRLEETLRNVPGVESVTAADVPLIANSMSQTGFIREGHETEKHSESGNHNTSNMLEVGNDYFRTMGIPIIAGRAFGSQDTETSTRVAIVNRALVKKFFGNEDPIGKRFHTGDESPADRRPWIEIIGVSADTRYSNMKDEPPTLHFDLYRQDTSAGGLTYMVRTRMDPAAITPSLRSAVARVDGDLPLIDIRTQDEQIAATLQQERIFASLTAGFGVLAVALACVGIYGMMAYRVTQRTQEIGVRLALGAQRSQIRAMVLREAGWLGGSGVLVGLIAAFLLSKLVESMLYATRPGDPVSLAGAAVLLLSVALLAAWLPALRASRLEPVEALRHE